jgi:hypothetical protein
MKPLSTRDVVSALNTAFNHPDDVINFKVLKNGAVIPDKLVDRDRIMASEWKGDSYRFNNLIELGNSGLFYHLQEAGYSPGIIDSDNW